MKKPASSPAPKFTSEEIEAIVLGLCWVAGDEDHSLAGAAAGLGRSSLPQTYRSTSYGRPSNTNSGFTWNTRTPKDGLRPASSGRSTSLNTTTPLVAAWCEHRRDFRNFRLDRVQTAYLLERYPARRSTLLARMELEQDENGW